MSLASHVIAPNKEDDGGEAPAAKKQRTSAANEAATQPFPLMDVSAIDAWPCHFASLGAFCEVASMTGVEDPEPVITVGITKASACAWLQTHDTASNTIIRLYPSAAWTKGVGDPRVTLSNMKTAETFHEFEIGALDRIVVNKEGSGAVNISKTAVAVASNHQKVHGRTPEWVTLQMPRRDSKSMMGMENVADFDIKPKWWAVMKAGPFVSVATDYHLVEPAHPLKSTTSVLLADKKVALMNVPNAADPHSEDEKETTGASATTDAATVEPPASGFVVAVPTLSNSGAKGNKNEVVVSRDALARACKVMLRSHRRDEPSDEVVFFGECANGMAFVADSRGQWAGMAPIISHTADS